MVRTWEEDARVIDETVDKASRPVTHGQVKMHHSTKFGIQTVAGTELSLTRAEAATFSGMLRRNAKGLRKVMEKAQAKSKALQLKEWEKQNPNLPKAGKN